MGRRGYQKAVQLTLPARAENRCTATAESRRGIPYLMRFGVGEQTGIGLDPKR
jgi:hypothetical protein